MSHATLKWIVERLTNRMVWEIWTKNSQAIHRSGEVEKQNNQGIVSPSIRKSIFHYDAHCVFAHLSHANLVGCCVHLPPRKFCTIAVTLHGHQLLVKRAFHCHSCVFDFDSRDMSAIPRAGIEVVANRYRTMLSCHRGLACCLSQRRAVQSDRIPY